jgi:GH24 family phage-related lysozyme (muramidase)
MDALDTTQLRRDEGSRSIAYQDTRGHWTVGIGHNLETPLPAAVIDLLFQYDVLAATEAAILVTPTWAQLTPGRQEVLRDMAFNLGQAGLAAFKMLFRALAQGDYAGAAREMLDSDAARQLPARYTRLARQMATGERG